MDCWCISYNGHSALIHNANQLQFHVYLPWAWLYKLKLREGSFQALTQQGKSDRLAPVQPRGQGDTAANKERTYLTLEGGSALAATNPEIRINLPEAKESVSPINISISNQKTPGSGQQQHPGSEILKLRDMLLKDSSLEASEI